MTRDLRFRAWDKKEGKWLFGYELPNLGGFSMFGEIMLMGEWSSLLSSRFPNDIEEIEVTQWTGLKDKSGKDVYEGDIVPCVYAFDGCTKHIMVVEWNDDRAGFFPRWDYEKCHQKGVSKTMHDLTRLEVIGNRFENPELLTTPTLE